MNLTELLPPEAVDLHSAPKDRAAGLSRLVDLCAATGRLRDRDEFLREVMRREAQGSTAVGHGVAVPHARSAAVCEAGLCALASPLPVDWPSPDGAPVRLMFLIAVPQDGDETHLAILSRLAGLLEDPSIREGLLRAVSPAQFIDRLRSAEARLETLAEAKGPGQGSPEAKDLEQMPQVLAVTACPTGIAHTYLAAQSLTDAAQRMGVSIKVETNGARGVESRLTDEEIASCDGVIVAADTKVETNRFAGRPVLLTGTGDALRKPEELIRSVLEGRIPRSGGRAARGGLWRQVYRHLMSGVSRMLPFAVGGGLFSALGALAGMTLPPDSVLSPLIPFLRDRLGGLALGVMLPVLAAYIAQSIADRPGLMIGFVCGAIVAHGRAGFLGALLAGFVAGIVTLGLRRALRFLPALLEGVKTLLLYPLLGLLLAGGVTAFLIVPPVSLLDGTLVRLLGVLPAGSAVALGTLLGAMMGVDLGGPVNKAAFVFAAASLVGVSGELVSSPLMASVLLGGMTPPLTLALCMLLFRDRFTAGERRSGVSCLVTGLCFVTEGAIPLAAADPLHVLPACILGSAVAGGLSAAFGCSIPVPHGGIFVLPAAQGAPWLLLALGCGMLAGALLLAALKKPIRAA